MTVETTVMRRAVSTPVLMASISALAAGVSQTTGPVTGTTTAGTSVMKMWLVLVLPLVGHHISLFVFVFAYILCFVFSFGMDHVAVIFGWYAHYASDILHIMLEFIFWTASSVSTIFKFKNVSIFKNLYEGPHILFICAPSRFGYIRFNFIVIMQNREPVKYTVVSI